MAFLGYGFIIVDLILDLEEELSELEEEPLNEDIKNVDFRSHGDNFNTRLIVITQSSIDVSGWEDKPETVNLEKLNKLSEDNIEKWNKTLIKISKHLNKKYKTKIYKKDFKWYIGCNFC